MGRKIPEKMLIYLTVSSLKSHQMIQNKIIAFCDAKNQFMGKYTPLASEGQEQVQWF